MKFNDRLLDLRKRRGLSQDELGEHLNTSRQTISKWENGSSYPDFHSLILLSNFFNVSLDVLMKGEQIKNNNVSSLKMLKINFNQLRYRMKKLKKMDMFTIFADVMIGLLLLRFTLSCVEAIF